MASRRISRKRGPSTTQQQPTYPADAFYAPLFKNRTKKLSKFLKWINSTPSDEITKILICINDTITSSTPAAVSDKLSHKLEVIVLADIIQSGYRSYSLLSAADSDKKYEKELKALGIESSDTIKMIIKLIKKIYKAKGIKMEQMDGGDVSYPHFQNLRWRLDVTISNSNLKRVLKPSLVLSITLSDGRIKYMECTVEKFHELRFNASRVLREMQVLQQRFIDEENVNKSEQSQYVNKYKKLASIAGINNLSQIETVDTKTDE